MADRVASMSVTSFGVADEVSDDLGEPKARSDRPSRNLKRILPVVSVLVVLGLWQLIGSRINPILLSTPTSTISAFGHMISRGQLIPAFFTAMEDLWVGFGLAIVVGIATGVLMGRSEVAEKILDPYINFFQATPLIALVPLVVIWFGVGFEARVAVTFVLAVWSVIINTFVGVRSTPSALIDVASIYKLSRWEVVSKITLPNAVPYIFAGLRIALGKALIGMLIAEMEVSVTGLGGLVTNYGNSFQTAYLLAGVFTASVVGVIGVILLNLVKRRFFPWVGATTSEQQVRF
ncbi:MAG: putative amino acid transporter, permease protein [Acidimicrobiaceae bacterium]|nr:putative amino acid transporter, permease protein [Acidimicrobiaceae bacterium]